MANYVFQHQDNVYSPDGKSTIKPAEISAHNARLERDELAQWALAPSTHGAYVVHSSTAHHVTTWLGTVLGVIKQSTPFHTNFGVRMEAIRVRGTNGAMYWGRYSVDNSQLCILHKIKGRK